LFDEVSYTLMSMCGGGVFGGDGGGGGDDGDAGGGGGAPGSGGELGCANMQNEHSAYEL
jgi:hypothetical protein